MAACSCEGEEKERTQRQMHERYAVQWQRGMEGVSE